MGEYRLADVVDRRFDGVVLDLHDIRQRRILPVVRLHLLLQPQILHVKALIHFLELLHLRHHVPTGARWGGRSA